MIDFTAVNARARGLGTQLPTRAELEALVSLPADELGKAFVGHRSLVFLEGVPLLDIDDALRRRLELQLTLLARWSGAAPLVEFVFAELDRLALRALLRGALGAVPAADRLRGLVATPTLPRRVLESLARAPTPAAVVSQLVSLRHPSAADLTLLVEEKAHPDLLALEAALVAGSARRALAAAKQGDEVLVTFVRERIDVINLSTALRLGASPLNDSLDLFVEGGRELDRKAFEALVAAKGATMTIRQLLGSTGLAALVDTETIEPSVLERRFLRHALTRLRKTARELPLSSAPTLGFLLGLEATARDLRRVAWAALQRAPAPLVTPGLVTP